MAARIRVYVHVDLSIYASICALLNKANPVEYSHTMGTAKTPYALKFTQQISRVELLWYTNHKKIIFFYSWNPCLYFVKSMLF